MNPWVLGSHFKSVFAFLGWHVVSSVVCLLFAFLGWHVVSSVVCLSGLACCEFCCLPVVCLSGLACCEFCCLELIVYYCPSKKMIESEFRVIVWRGIY